MTTFTHKCETCIHYGKNITAAPCLTCYFTEPINNKGANHEFLSSTTSSDSLEEGIKYDLGKPQLSLIPKEFLDSVAAVLEFGAAKYQRDNWRKGIKYSRVLDAAMRHLTAFINNETIDAESNLNHLSHAACCLAFLLTYEAHPEKYKEFDDRYKNT
jgi:hypothetical protein